MGATLEPRPGVRMKIYKRAPATVLGEEQKEIPSVAAMRLPGNDIKQS